MLRGYSDSQNRDTARRVKLAKPAMRGFYRIVARKPQPWG
jgi:hypothetical protein